MNSDRFTFELTPEAFWRWGRAAIVGVLALGLAMVLMLAWMAPMGLLAVPVVLVGGVALWYLFRHPLVNLAVVLGGTVLLANMVEGFQPQELVYGLYYLSFLGSWFLSRFFFYKDSVITHPADAAILTFLLWMTCSIALNILFGGIFTRAVSEWTALILLGFYFPIKEACRRSRYSPCIIFGVLIWLGLFFAIRNLYNYQQIIAEATLTWQVTKGRIGSYEMPLLIASFASLIMALYVQQWRARLISTVGFLLFFSSLILTQSRGYWIDFAFGFGILFLLIDRKKKLFILGWGGAGMATALFLGTVFFGNMMELVFFGLLDRVMSIGTAFTQDISLINRFFEYRAVFDEIVKNPIIGYGPGVPYHVFDILADYTNVKTFGHNGYLLLWYRFGIIGLGLILFVWGSSIWQGLKIFKDPQARRQLRLYGLIAAIGLIAIIPSTNTSNSFYLSHNTIMFALLTGWIAGLRRRVQAEEKEAVAP